MRYTSIIREVLTRLQFHNTTPLTGQANALLADLKVKKSGEWRIDGDADLPRLAVIDMEVTEIPGKASLTITLFLSTKRKLGWVTDSDDGTGAMADWIERVMDAVEIRPSDGASDQLLRAHNPDGTLMLVNGQPVDLLATQFEWNAKMLQITDLAFTYQLDLLITPPLSRRATRRTNPIPAAQR